jgi:hypothetical protein
MAKNIAKGGRDNYPTPQIYADWAVKRALELHRCHPPLLVGLEPGCGPAAPFLTALTKYSRVAAIGIEKEKWIPKTQGEFLDELDAGTYMKIHMGVDFLSAESDKVWLVRPDVQFDIIATNPPFSVCEAFMDKSLSLLHPRGVMVFLLRMAIMGSKKRLDFWKAHMPLEIAHFCRRIGFDPTSSNTDYAEYACFFWAGTELAAEWALIRGHRNTVFYLVDNVRDSVNERGCLTEIGAPIVPGP